MATIKHRYPPLEGMREKRLFRDLTQTDMGKLIKTTQSHYRQIEEGIIRLDVHRAKIIANFLECTIDELL
jgi:transcriptional regulator with XRE-family HTH domain